MRWRILKSLYDQAPYWTDGDVLQRIVEAPPKDLHRHIDYLSQKGLLLLDPPHLTQDNPFKTRLTAQGIDYIEYETPDIPGCGRPSHP